MVGQGVDRGVKGRFKNVVVKPIDQLVDLGAHRGHTVPDGIAIDSILLNCRGSGLSSELQTVRWSIAGSRLGCVAQAVPDFRLDDVCVPAERTVPLGAFFVGRTPRPSTAYRTQFYDAAGAQIAAVGLGDCPLRSRICIRCTSASAKPRPYCARRTCTCSRPLKS